MKTEALAAQATSGTRLRWLARILGVPVFAFSLFWLYFALNSPFAQSASISDPIILALMLPMLGYMVAWFWERAGALLMAVGALALATAIYPRSLSENTASFLLLFLLFSLPYLILSLLFFYAGKARQNERTLAQGSSA